MFYIDTYMAPVGEILMASNGSHLTGLWLKGQKYYALGLEQSAIKKELLIFTQTKQWLDTYFEGKMPVFTPPLLIEKATPFQKRVYDVLLGIPFGQTMTYGEIAEIIQTETTHKVSARAVGGAVSRNPISIIIPCHRVVGSNGSLTGYAGGLQAKKSLLTLEKAGLCTVK